MSMRHSAILKPGENCWRIEQADRLSLLVDGADYFHAFRETAKNARRSVLIIGWDIDGRFMLERDHTPDGFPTTLRDFLNTLARRKKQLQIHVLDWDFTMLFATDREWLPVYKMDWTTHRRLHFHLDKHYPAGASHHQKIVVIDDRVAFVGGLDFALGRWDTSGHLADDPRRLGELRGEWIAPLIVMLVYIALTLFSDRVVAAITSPETFRFASLLILALIIGAGTWWLSRWLLRRQRRGSGHKP